MALIGRGGRGRARAHAHDGRGPHAGDGDHPGSLYPVGDSLHNHHTFSWRGGEVQGHESAGLGMVSLNGGADDDRRSLAVGEASASSVAAK